FEAWNNLAEVYKELKRYKEAALCYEKVGELKPERQSEILEQIEGLYLKGENFEKAISYYEMKLKENPDNPIYWYKLGMMHSRLGSFDKAASCFKKCLTIEPESYIAKHAIAML